MKRSSFLIVAIFAAAYSMSGYVFAAEKINAQAPTVTAPTPKATVKEVSQSSEQKAAKAKAKEYSTSEMIAELKKMVEDEAELVNAVPGLAKRSVDGKKIYEYNGKKLEELDKDTISKLFSASKRFVTVQNTQHVQRQLQTIRQVENINRIQSITILSNPPTVPKTPAQPPKTYTPPRTYK